MQVFTEPFLMTNGGPGWETLTPTLHIYNRAFIRIDLGYAAAWSVTMIVVLLIFSAIYQTLNRKLSGVRALNRGFLSSTEPRTPAGRLTYILVVGVLLVIAVVALHVGAWLGWRSPAP